MERMGEIKTWWYERDVAQQKGYKKEEAEKKRGGGQISQS